MSPPDTDRLQLAWRPFQFRLPRTLVTAHGALAERRGWLLRLRRDDGAVGWGEAAPWPQPVGPPPPGLSPPAGRAATQRLQAVPQPQLAALAATIADLGLGLGRRELEQQLPALPACLGFALGLALAELDGLGAPWRDAPASALLLPAGEAALVALETVLERAEQLQIHKPAAGSPGRLGASGAVAPGAVGAVVLGAAAAVDAAAVGGAADAGTPPAAAGRGAPQASEPLTFKWKVAAGPDPEERAVLEHLLARLPHGSRLRLDANGGWDRATAQAWAERLASEPRLEWLEQPLAPGDLEGLEALAAVVPVALDESLQLDPLLGSRWCGWQVRRPALEGDPRPLLRQLLAGTPRLMLSTAFETGIGRRFLAHLAALQQDGPTPTAPGLAPGWRPAGALFDPDPELVWAAAAEAR
ncbi:MAG: enolase C-terminal domain-like protein [Cyanobium sp. ELA507]